MAACRSSPWAMSGICRPTCAVEPAPTRSAAWLFRRCPRSTLQRPGVEGIAAADIAAVETGAEPTHALLRGAVGEGVGDDRPLRLFLQAVVADGAGGVDGLLDVAAFHPLVLLLRLV